MSPSRTCPGLGHGRRRELHSYGTHPITTSRPPDLLDSNIKLCIYMRPQQQQIPFERILRLLPTSPSKCHCQPPAGVRCRPETPRTPVDRPPSTHVHLRDPSRPRSSRSTQRARGWTLDAGCCALARPRPSPPRVRFGILFGLTLRTLRLAGCDAHTRHWIELRWLWVVSNRLADTRSARAPRSQSNTPVQSSPNDFSFGIALSYMANAQTATLTGDLNFAKRECCQAVTRQSALRHARLVANSGVCRQLCLGTSSYCQTPHSGIGN
ncbi:hypothetical protein GY45DRAFT_1034934 [Cubamyces sp. BRFM 1775]|nr:hypothetical protein GY45DRAFT_1034934 [Cubamyces sp. BRFM 1775]